MANGQHEQGNNPAWLVPAIMGAASVVGAWFRSRKPSEDPAPKKGSCLESLARISALEQYRALEEQRYAARIAWEAHMDQRLEGIENHVFQMALGRNPSATPQ